MAVQIRMPALSPTMEEGTLAKWLVKEGDAVKSGERRVQAGPRVEQLAGVVERVTFHAAETGFCVLRVKARGQRDLVTVTGHAAAIGAGEHVEVAGVWINDRNHGLQFKADRIEATVPTTLQGLEKYSAPA